MIDISKATHDEVIKVLEEKFYGTEKMGVMAYTYTDISGAILLTSDDSIRLDNLEDVRKIQQEAEYTLKVCESLMRRK